MFRFEKRLTQIILEARNHVIETRKQNIITTIDLFAELIEDSESLLYLYLTQVSPEEEISAQLEEFRKFAEKDANEEENVSFNFTLISNGGTKKTTVETFFTLQLHAYILAADKLAKTSDRKEICAEDLLLVILQDPIKTVTKFLRKLQVNVPELREEFEQLYYEAAQEEAKEIVIPEEMQMYLSEFTGDDTVLGREKEIEECWNILLKKRKRNVILVGEAGVGKTAIVQKMVSQIKNGTAPEEFKNFYIYSLDVTGIVNGTKFRGDSEKRFTELINFIKVHTNVILFIDEVHLILGAGRSEGTNIDLANALKPLLASDNSRTIAATTEIEYKRYFSTDPAIKRRFEKVVVEEPRIYEVYPMIKSRVEELSEFHKVKISRNMVDFITLYASCFSAETKNPDRTIDLIDRSMVVAKRSKKKEVTVKSVLANFKVNMELFENISDEDRRITAYHEAGHYISFCFLPYLQKTVKPVVVSIYPAEDYLGITVTEKRKNVVKLMGKQAYLERIASCLAGGIAEKIVNEVPNSGVSSDSEYATELAKHLVSESGFYNDFFYNLDTLATEKSVEKITREVKEILKQAKQIAEKVVSEHRRELDAVVNALMEEHVVSDEDLKVIMAEAVQTDVQKQTMTT